MRFYHSIPSRPVASGMFHGKTIKFGRVLKNKRAQAMNVIVLKPYLHELLQSVLQRCNDDYSYKTRNFCFMGSSQISFENSSKKLCQYLSRRSIEDSEDFSRRSSKKIIRGFLHILPERAQYFIKENFEHSCYDFPEVQGIVSTILQRIFTETQESSFKYYCEHFFYG